MFKLPFFPVLTTMAMVLGACATSPEMSLTLEQKLEARNYTVGEEVKQIRNYRLNGWNTLDSKHVIMRVGASEHYLVSLRNSCYELSSAANIAFTTTVGNLSVHDKLLVKGPAGIIEHCFIEALNKLQKKDHNAKAN